VQKQPKLALAVNLPVYAGKAMKREAVGGPPPLGSLLVYLPAASSASRGEYGSPPMVVFAQMGSDGE